MRLHNAWCYRHLLLSYEFGRSLWNCRRNLEAMENNRPLPAGPFLAELDVTYRCNLRCRMCQRWQSSRRDEMAFSEYQSLAAEFKMLGVRQVSIAGGEPLLREDVFRIIGALAGRGMSVNLCTNGTLVEKYGRQIVDSGATCVTVSLDGATAGPHDEIRGKAGSWGRIEKGVRSFKEQRRGRRAILRVRMTVSNANAHEMRAFYERWRNVADDVLFQPVHRCRKALYIGLPEGDVNLEASVIDEQLQGTPMARDPYMRNLVASLAACGSYPSIPCYAGILMVRIDPWGNVYPCLEQHVCVGSVRSDGFSGVWNSKPLDEERRRLMSRRTCNCWYNNTALIGHFGALIKKTIPAGRSRRTAQQTIHAPTRPPPTAAGPVRLDISAIE